VETEQFLKTALRRPAVDKAPKCLPFKDQNVLAGKEENDTNVLQRQRSTFLSFTPKEN